MRMTFWLALALLAPALGAAVQAKPAPGSLEALHARIDAAAAAVMPKVVAWRRDIHQHPELGNRERRTAGLVADHLRSLGLEVRTGLAKTGVVGVLRGGKPGPVVALRADMDALPVTEETDLPFRSTVRTTYNGKEVGVMHACGHDLHTAMLLGAAEVLAGMRADLPGTVVFLFQPAEEGAPEGEEGGADKLITDGALDNPKVEAVFGLHVFPFENGALKVRPGGIMAGSRTFRIAVRGRQTHAALPWSGIDPIVVSAQIVLALQTIVSRQSDLTTGPAVISVAMIEGGNRTNIIPDEVRLAGTIRVFDTAMGEDILARVRRTAESIAAAAGATAEASFSEGNPVTFNDPALTARMSPTLARIAPGKFDPAAKALTTSEDFAFYQKKVPGVFFFLGVAPPGADPAKLEMNHSPRFNPDEAPMIVGVRALASLAVDFLAGTGK
jgi:amidohydrolase